MVPHGRLGIDATPGPIGGRIDSAGFVEAIAAGVAIDPAGAGVNQTPNPCAARQGVQQAAGARIRLAPRRWGRQVQDGVGQ